MAFMTISSKILYSFDSNKIIDLFGAMSHFQLLSYKKLSFQVIVQIRLKCGMMKKIVCCLCVSR